jgi:hypothetical protein
MEEATSWRQIWVPEPEPEPHRKTVQTCDEDRCIDGVLSSRWADTSPLLEIQPVLLYATITLPHHWQLAPKSTGIALPGIACCVCIAGTDYVR